ncbi:hypothetical protein J6590_078008 [Homalodisca vitripennis]|nr:hypothetical protein J6590_078008 [Homalodisca vitripennis]
MAGCVYRLAPVGHTLRSLLAATLRRRDRRRGACIDWPSRSHPAEPASRHVYRTLFSTGVTLYSEETR